MSHRRVVNIEMPFTKDYVFLARRAVRELARSLSFTKCQLDEITLAVGEACTNAVKHGCCSKTYSSIRLKCILRPHEICILISNPRDSSAPLMIPVEPDTEKENGYGLFIMNNLMDRVRIRHTSHHATVMMTKIVRHNVLD